MGFADVFPAAHPPANGLMVPRQGDAEGRGWPASGFVVRTQGRETGIEHPNFIAGAPTVDVGFEHRRRAAGNRLARSCELEEYRNWQPKAPPARAGSYTLSEELGRAKKRRGALRVGDPMSNGPYGAEGERRGAVMCGEFGTGIGTQLPNMGRDAMRSEGRSKRRITRQIGTAEHALKQGGTTPRAFLNRWSEVRVLPGPPRRPDACDGAPLSPRGSFHSMMTKRHG